MKILIDTDVLLDVALNRKPWVESSAGVLRWAETRGSAAIAWHSLSNCAYLLENDGREFIDKLLMIVEIALTGRKDALKALRLPLRDLEDALQAVAASSWGAQYIVTRNLKDFKGSPVTAIAPETFMEIIRR